MYLLYYLVVIRMIYVYMVILWVRNIQRDFMIHEYC